MSDPTARRGDNIMALLKEMTSSSRGWSKREMLDFLFVRYRGGVREQTLESIFNQLKDRAVIYAKPQGKAPTSTGGTSTKRDSESSQE